MNQICCKHAHHNADHSIYGQSSDQKTQDYSHVVDAIWVREVCHECWNKAAKHSHGRQTIPAGVAGHNSWVDTAAQWKATWLGCRTAIRHVRPRHIFIRYDNFLDRFDFLVISWVGRAQKRWLRIKSAEFLVIVGATTSWRWIHLVKWHYFIGIERLCSAVRFLERRSLYFLSFFYLIRVHEIWFDYNF